MATATTPVLTNDDDDGVDFVCRCALRLLAAWCSSAVGIPGRPCPGQLPRRLGDDDRDVRRSAARALGGLGEAAGPFAAGLAACLEDFDEASRDAAVDALARLGPAAAPCAPEVARRLRHWNLYVRTAAARVLGHLGEAAAPFEAQLAALLEDAAPQLREAAGAALELRGMKRAAVGKAFAEMQSDSAPRKALPGRASVAPHPVGQGGARLCLRQVIFNQETSCKLQVLRDMRPNRLALAVARRGQKCLVVRGLVEANRIAREALWRNGTGMTAPSMKSDLRASGPRGASRANAGEPDDGVAGAVRRAPASGGGRGPGGRGPGAPRPRGGDPRARAMAAALGGAPPLPPARPARALGAAARAAAREPWPWPAAAAAAAPERCRRGARAPRASSPSRGAALRACGFGALAAGLAAPRARRRRHGAAAGGRRRSALSLRRAAAPRVADVAVEAPRDAARGASAPEPAGLGEDMATIREWSRSGERLFLAITNRGLKEAMAGELERRFQRPSAPLGGRLCFSWPGSARGPPLHGAGRVVALFAVGMQDDLRAICGGADVYGALAAFVEEAAAGPGGLRGALAPHLAELAGQRPLRFNARCRVNTFGAEKEAFGLDADWTKLKLAVRDGVERATRWTLEPRTKAVEVTVIAFFGTDHFALGVECPEPDEGDGVAFPWARLARPGME
ncbi:unnamed protein product, partial [Prorocentrum cordatum]